MSQFFPAMTRNIFVSPRKFLESPDSRQNLQIPEEFCFSPETTLVRVVTPRRCLRVRLDEHSSEHSSAMFQHLHGCKAFLKFLFLDNLTECINNKADVVNF